MSDILNMHPADVFIDVSVRVHRVLTDADIHTMQDLLNKSPKDMLQYPNFGRKSLRELREELALLGLSLRDE